MSLIQRIENIIRLWQLILPDIPKPQAVWVSRWCSYPDSAIEKGIVRASKKFAPNRTGSVIPDPELVYQYVCGVARHESKGEQNATRTN
ncbi:MAG TPA: hypothetical protein VFA60_01115 [Terriglobales bacterium]|nr:hypothetical protein [Terriglobales bacterium]